MMLIPGWYFDYQARVFQDQQRGTDLGIILSFPLLDFSEALLSSLLGFHFPLWNFGSWRIFAIFLPEVGRSLWLFKTDYSLLTPAFRASSLSLPSVLAQNQISPKTSRATEATLWGNHRQPTSFPYCSFFFPTQPNCVCNNHHFLLEYEC